MSITRLDKLLKSGCADRLDKIVRHAQDMGDLAQTLRSVLGADAASHLLAANLRDHGELVLICSSSSWAARMRFESELLLEAARQAGVKADRCCVKVARSQREL
jgi:hypothetical protein